MVVPDSLTLKCRVNRSTVPQGIESEVILLASLQAIEQPEEDRRNPISIIIVLDRSFSMAEQNKLELCKKTLTFLCKEVLNENDRLGLVCFDSESDVVFPSQNMTQQNKDLFLAKLAKVVVGTQTNLSSGLFQGLDMLRTLHDSSTEAVVSAVMLLSDGIATSGITDMAKLLRMTRNILGDFPGDTKPSIHCFGYGETYDQVLKELAEGNGGTFYDIANVEDVPLAFADTMGGLLHVAAQNVTIGIEVSGGAAEIDDSPLTKCAGGRMEKLSGCACKLRLNDIYLGEHKDILIKLRLPNVETAFTTVQCKVRVTFVDVIKEGPSSLECVLTINRSALGVPATIPEEDEDTEVKRHMIRVETANALESAKKQAELGHFENSRATILSTIGAATRAMKAMRLEEEDDDMMREIMSDLRESEEILQSPQQFHQQAGSKTLDSYSWSHANQRSNNVSKKSALSIPSAPGAVKSAGLSAAAAAAASTASAWSRSLSSYDGMSKVNMVNKSKSYFDSEQS